ncbi:prepilin-type N-terminal cleavage/methylation domain-containing protein [Collimonas pratensis]|uniref:type IV pilin protein n=1 Tax=Collimonas pratensis TaxID=279113 RepID=UPI00143D1C68|nr:type IV pilin protein [Collimonas pratensis]NKI72653.1 prepilin-type N-terminal cleavage/methylation domain-containing protein [Collimonas pratensis]
MKHRNVASMQRGFTLIEVMVVVAVVAILAAVAVPNYAQYVQRGNRAQAMATLLKYGNWMQQQYTINNSYQPGGNALSLPVFADAGSKYAFAIRSSSVSGFVLEAVPATNDKCGTFLLDNTGKRDSEKGEAPAATSADCWAGK